MNYSNKNLEKFSSYNNKKLFENVENARCYFCGTKFLTKDILNPSKEYIIWDKHGFCFCQYCSVDSVLPEHEDYDISDDVFIQKMYDYWFVLRD